MQITLRQNISKIRRLNSLQDPVINFISFVLEYVAKYEETSTTALSANPAVAVQLLTINGWILMQRKVTGGSVSFNKNWAEYRDGFGSAAGNDNYWLGLDKIYRLMQLGSVTLRVEVCKLRMPTRFAYQKHRQRHSTCLLQNYCIIVIFEVSIMFMFLFLVRVLRSS